MKTNSSYPPDKSQADHFSLQGLKEVVVQQLGYSLVASHVVICVASFHVLLRLWYLVFFAPGSVETLSFAIDQQGGQPVATGPGRQNLVWWGRCHADGHDEGVDSYQVTPRWRLRAGSGFLWSHRVQGRWWWELPHVQDVELRLWFSQLSSDMQWSLISYEEVPTQVATCAAAEQCVIGGSLIDYNKMGMFSPLEILRNAVYLQMMWLGVPGLS